MSAKQPTVSTSPTEYSTPSEHDSVRSNDKGAAPLAPGQDLATQQTQRVESYLGNAILQFLRIRKGKREEYDLDAVHCHPAQYLGLGEHRGVQELYIHTKWENWSAFGPSFRWTWREERATRRKVDWKIMLTLYTWVCVMFAALSIDRNNISNAVSDNMLDDLGLSQQDYKTGQTIARVGFLIAELPSQIISKRLGPDLWIPIQLCIFSITSAMQFFLKGRASCYSLPDCDIQGGFIPDTILYLSYFYTGTSLPMRLAWYWMSSQLVGIGVGFAAVGLLSMSGILGYAGWRWLFLIEGTFTFLIGVASFFLMPQCPAKTKSRWNPKGYFTEKEEKIIVNSVIRDDPQKGGMYNRQGLSVRQIWEGRKTTIFDQYLTISFRQLGFNVIQTNLLKTPNIVGSSITMLLITAFSELINNRSFVAMAEDFWLLPCFAALLALPDPIGPWVYFAIATVLLSFPYTHPIQVAWTSRNAGSVQNRTVSAALYNMCVQVSGMIGANIYQSSDSPRYFKANKGLLVICVWMCVIQYPVTYFYYRWRNNAKAKKWDVMSPEEQHHYRQTTTDQENKRLDFRFAT
ncbi:major facilitator superfamily domain-containing protein [Aspergillus undulatus]|uniref:major facilitator superfamily domain-containing protein n=1 Tax=Aspergillus undulatus TaxID=1810928 RepID=UPI003CCCBF3A